MDIRSLVLGAVAFWASAPCGSQCCRYGRRQLHAMLASASIKSLRSCSRNSGVSGWPCLLMTCWSAASKTSSSFPAMVSEQLISLGVLRQSIILRAMTVLPSRVLSQYNGGITHGCWRRCAPIPTRPRHRPSAKSATQPVETYASQWLCQTHFIVEVAITNHLPLHLLKCWD